MKRYFITLMAVLFLCLGFSSQVEAKTTKITLSDSGNKHHTIQESKLGVNEVTVAGKDGVDPDFVNYYTYFKTDKTGYYTFILNNMYNRNGYTGLIGIDVTPLVPMGKSFNTEDFPWLNEGCKKFVLFLPKETTILIDYTLHPSYYNYTIKYSSKNPGGKVYKYYKGYNKYNIVSGGVDGKVIVGNPYYKIGRNYELDKYLNSTYFKVPYTGSYKFDSNARWDVRLETSSGKYYDLYSSNIVELEKGDCVQVYDGNNPGGFTDITLISADMGTKTLKYNDNLSLKIRVSGKATWKVSNSRAKIVKISSKSVQIKGVKEGKVKVTAKVDKTSYVWTINVKKTAAQKKQEEAAKYANSTLQVRYDLLYNDKSKGLAFISSKEYRSTDLNISTVIDIYSGNEVVNSIPYSCVCLESESTIEISSPEGLPITDVKLRDSKISKSTKEGLYYDKVFVASALVRVQENGESVIGLTHYYNTSGLKHCLFYVTWYNDDTGELIYYTSMRAENIEVELPAGFDDTNTSDDPSYHNCCCY